MRARRALLAVLGCACAIALGLMVGAGVALAGPLFGYPLGHEAGQVEFSHGTAVDRVTGAIYVEDNGNGRIDKFDGSGKFLLAWGEGVLNGAAESQVCTTSCRQGGSGAGAGEFKSPGGVAVDNDPSSASHGDVYVVDNQNFRVQKFDSSGKFLLMLGGHVNEAKDGTPGASEAEKDVCVAGEACTEGTPGTGDGEFEWADAGSFIAAGPGGRIYVGDRARVQIFEASGAWHENLSLAGLYGTGKVKSLAVDSAGDVFVSNFEVPGVHEFEPGGIEKSVQLDSGSSSIWGLSIDASNDLFIDDQSSGGPHFLEYGPGGEELESFGTGSVQLQYGFTSFVFDEALGDVLIYNSDGLASDFGVWGFALPPAGPLVEGESATPEPRGAVTFEARIDPEGNETTYRFEYVDEAHFKASGFASASVTASTVAGSGFEGLSVSTRVTGLVPGETYHYRVLAQDALGHAVSGSGQSVTLIPSVLIEGPWATNVAASSATLNARIDPLGVSTTYRWEYGTSTAYGHVFTGSVGEAEGYVPVSYHLQELEPATTYHYRLVVVNEVGTIVGADHTIITQPVPSQSLTLPDGRAWELVSPADKKGGLIEVGLRGTTGTIQAAVAGDAISYVASRPMGEGVANNALFNQVLSAHGPGGWSSQDITFPHRLNKSFTGGLPAEDPEYDAFSPDLSLASVEPEDFVTMLSPEASERTLYLRDNSTGGFTPLVTAGNVIPGTKFAGDEDYGNPNFEMHFLGASRDLSHVVFRSALALVPPAVGDTPISAGGNGEQQNLYEWGAGRLQLVNILPNGQPTKEGDPTFEGNAFLGVNNEMTAHAISSDGRMVVWHHSIDLNNNSLAVDLYVRDMVAEKTVQLGGRGAMFQTMSSDGSKIFFLDKSEREDHNGELFVFDRETGVSTDLTAGHGPGEGTAGVRAAIGASEDGSSVYFVANGVLAPGASPDEDNLYLAHETEGKWQTKLIAALSPEDEKTWFGLAPEGVDNASQLMLVSSRVSPDGRYLAFMSSRPLTGYDNTDALSGQPDEEVFLYDAGTDRLACVSCDPTGARPVGVFDEPDEVSNKLAVDQLGTWKGHWLAGSIQGWRSLRGLGSPQSEYQARFLSDSGRLFFESPDALVPQATNGLEDVYEYEPPGVGDCASASPGFSEPSGGCVSLVSSGIASQEAVFMDASENGDDAFFQTASKLVPEDYDTSNDVYDAHACSGSWACVSAPVSPPPCTSGDSCKPAPSPQPAVFGPAPSATFSGQGNVVSSRIAVKRRRLTRAQRLAAALRACRSKKGAHRRAVCRRRARLRYRARVRSTMAPAGNANVRKGERG